MRARVLGVGLLALACSVAPAPLLPPPVSAATPVTEVAAPAAEPSAPPPASTGPAPPAPAAMSPEPAPLRLLIEPPYSALGHARLATEMLTLGRDEELFQWALGGASDPAHPSNRPGYHPATRVVVDVELLSRAPKGSAKRLERVARSNGYWPLRACFESAQRLAPKTERAARVRLTLSAFGKVLGSRSIGPAPERDYARCVLERLRALDFTPGFTRKLDVEISVKQWPGHAPVPPRAPDDAPSVRLSADAVAALEGLTPALGACYEKALAVDAKLWGRVALRLELANDGAVREATPVETHFPDPQVVECARQVMLGAHVVSPGVSALTFAVRFGGAPAPPLRDVEAAQPAPPAPPAESAGAPPAAAPPAAAPPLEPAPPAPH